MTIAIDDLLADVTRRYGFSSAQLLERTQISPDNHTYKVRADGAIYYLSGNVGSAASRRRQFAWVAYLRAHNIPVIDIVRTSRDKMLFLHGGMNWFLMREAIGASLESYSPQQALALGRLTGLLHRHGSDYVAPPGFATDYYKADLAQWQVLYRANRHLFIGEELRLIDAQFAWCADFEIRNVPHFFVHDDLFRSNLLWQGDEISCLIDFNSSRVAFYTEDFSKAFDSVIRESVNDDENAAWFMAGYGRHSCLAASDISSIRFFLTLDLLKIIACWCRDFAGIAQSGRHPRDLIRFFDHIDGKESFLRRYVSWP